MEFNIIDWGKIDYLKAWEEQKKLLQLRIDDKIPDTLIFCEHPAVVTLGRGSQREKESLGHLPFPAIEVERGGHATYHGPGQIVVYPIVKLAPSKATQFPDGLKSFIEWLENITIKSVEDFKIPASRIEGKTGVWIRNGEKKIASIGVAVKHWTTYHGLALNISTGIEPWRFINPCGFSAEIMTDLNSETGLDISFNDVKNLIINNATSPLVNILKTKAVNSIKSCELHS
ncbi:MAG: lipoyl(octanoyl) transferase LipB [Proteobacteria bacterium]|nr:lipoyl(octanoyl) transferase LipB [Pseudomonadota bacterium]